MSYLHVYKDIIIEKSRPIITEIFFLQNPRNAHKLLHSIKQEGLLYSYHNADSRVSFGHTKFISQYQINSEGILGL